MLKSAHIQKWCMHSKNIQKCIKIIKERKVEQKDKEKRFRWCPFPILSVINAVSLKSTTSLSPINSIKKVDFILWVLSIKLFNSFFTGCIFVVKCLNNTTTVLLDRHFCLKNKTYILLYTYLTTNFIPSPIICLFLLFFYSNCLYLLFVVFSFCFSLCFSLCFSVSLFCRVQFQQHWLWVWPAKRTN